ncbi:YcaO-like family protein [Paenibacillus dendritiformis]|uniref:YcaO-like family protein n=1 Tax=Paenibacillus dendritiformis TaxID=130049 RepID=UPI003B97C22E
MGGQNKDSIILDITSDFQIPVFLCVMENKNLLPPYIGCGASLCPYYALERALLELVQVYHLYNEYYEVLKKEDELILKRFSSLKKAQSQNQCLTISISTGDGCIR